MSAVKCLNTVCINVCKTTFGFKTKHSTIDALVECPEKRDTKVKALGVVFDGFEKALFTLNHSVFIRKLDCQGNEDSCFQWFKKNLSNREQRVKNLNFSSECQVMNCGVPQRSVLRAFLFLIYINELTIAC